MGARTGNPVWKDHPDTSTLITAARLNAIEGAIDATVATVNGTGPDSAGNVVVSGGGTSAPDATSSVKGVVALTGDLGGTAAAPTVPGLAGKVAKGELVFNVKDYGAIGNGDADDTAAIEAAIAALPERPGSFGSSAVLYFPAGRYLTDGGHSIPANRRVTVRGDGDYNSILYKRSGSAVSDLLTLNASYSCVQDLALDGNRTGAGSGDCLVLNASYAMVSSVSIHNAGLNGISIGKASTAPLTRLSGVLIRECAGYGVLVSASSFDGQWSQIDIGRCGLSGFRINAGSQTLQAVHSWGNGWEGGATDGFGGWLASGANILIGCQFETNYGEGLRLGGGSGGMPNNNITGCSIWGNGGRGLNAYNANFITISNSKFYYNGTRAVGNNLLTSTSGLTLDNCQKCVISGNAFFDAAVAVPAQTYNPTPTYPFAGRAADLTQSTAVYEINGTNDCVYAGNVMHAEDTSSGTAYVITGADNVLTGNLTGGAEPAIQAINAKTGAYTLVATDAGKLVTMTLATPADLTVPADVFTAGQRVDIADRGTARVTVVAGSGMTVNPPAGGSLVMEGRYAYASLVFISATEADLVGLVAAP